MKPLPPLEVSQETTPLILLAAGATLAEGCLTLRWLQHGDIGTEIVLHVLTVALLAMASWHNYKRNRNSLFMLLAPITAMAGPFGSGLCLLAALTYAISVKYVSPTAWLENLFEGEKDEGTEHIRDRIAFGMDDFAAADSVEPFRDILAGGTVLQKQMVLAKITRYFRPNLAPLLLQAMHDSNAAVRVQAATALARIERDFMKDRMKLEKNLAGTPAHNEAWLKLAQLYDEYAYAGLADEDERSAMREKAMEIYELHRHRDIQVRLDLARLYLRHGKPEQTCSLLADLLRENPEPIAITWYMEALFRLKRFGELRRASRKYAAYIRDTDCFEWLPEVGHAAAYWNPKYYKVPGETLTHAE